VKLLRIAARVAGVDWSDERTDEDVDKDPDFRAVLDFVNDDLGAATVSSCQGHLPGEQYEDVQEVMLPYLTLEESSPGYASARALLERSPWFDGSRRGKGGFVGLKEGVIGRWGSLLAWLRSNA